MANFPRRPDNNHPIASNVMVAASNGPFDSVHAIAAKNVVGSNNSESTREIRTEKVSGQ